MDKPPRQLDEKRETSETVSLASYINGDSYASCRRVGQGEIFTKFPLLTTACYSMWLFVHAHLSSVFCQSRTGQ